jgi:hypothetical protein
VLPARHFDVFILEHRQCPREPLADGVRHDDVVDSPREVATKQMNAHRHDLEILALRGRRFGKARIPIERRRNAAAIGQCHNQFGRDELDRTGAQIANVDFQRAHEKCSCHAFSKASRFCRRWRIISLISYAGNPALMATVRSCSQNLASILPLRHGHAPVHRLRSNRRRHDKNPSVKQSARSTPTPPAFGGRPSPQGGG